VRAVRIEARQKVVEPGLLLEHVRGGRLGGFALEREVHALVPAVLLWVSGCDAFDLDPQSQPPHRQLAQPVEGMRRCERDAVVPSETEVMTRQALL